MSNVEKICVLCGESCVGQARIKNEKGQYAHQKCVIAKQQQSESIVESESLYEDSYDDALDGGMNDLLDDLEVDGAENYSGEMSNAQACAGCGQRMSDGAVICMACGFNSENGRAMQTRSLDTISKGNSKIASIGSGAGGLAIKPILPIIGAVVGGSVGAIIWAFISYKFSVEIGWIAVGVGFLTGLGASIGSRGEGGALTGAMAALIAMGAITAGKYAAVSIAVEEAFGSTYFEPLTIDEVSDEMVFTFMADQICEEKIENGDSIGWENPELYVDAAVWPDDYPVDIRDLANNEWGSKSFQEKSSLRKNLSENWGMSVSDVDDDWAIQEIADNECRRRINNDEEINWDNERLPMSITAWPEDYPQEILDLTNNRWVDMDPDAQFDFRIVVLDSQNSERDIDGEFGQAIIKEGLIQSFMHPLDLLFMVLAVGTAYGVASNEG